MKIEFRQFNFEKDKEIVSEWGKDHTTINFPESIYNKEIFLSKIKKEYNIEPKGIFMITNFAFTPPKDIGFLWLNTKHDIHRQEDYGDIHYVHIIQEYRGKGIGKIMMRKADDYFKNKNVKNLRLGTSFNNKASIKLYEKMGYTIKRVIMEKTI